VSPEAASAVADASVVDAVAQLLKGDVLLPLELT
jgi:hypothetical protein